MRPVAPSPLAASLPEALPPLHASTGGPGRLRPAIAVAVLVGLLVVLAAAPPRAGASLFAPALATAAPHAVRVVPLPRGRPYGVTPPRFTQVQDDARSVGSSTRLQANGALGADPDGPQAKAEGFMLRLITWAAGKAVLAELDGLGNEGDLVVAPHAERMKDPEYAALVRAIEDQPLGDGDSWVRALAKENPRIALRVLEKRATLVRDFNFEQLRLAAEERVGKGNNRLRMEAVSIAGGLKNDNEAEEEDAAARGK